MASVFMMNFAHQVDEFSEAVCNNNNNTAVLGKKAQNEATVDARTLRRDIRIHFGKFR